MSPLGPHSEPSVHGDTQGGDPGPMTTPYLTPGVPLCCDLSPLVMHMPSCSGPQSM